MKFNKKQPKVEFNLLVKIDAPSFNPEAAEVIHYNLEDFKSINYEHLGNNFYLFKSIDPERLAYLYQELAFQLTPNKIKIKGHLFLEGENYTLDTVAKFLNQLDFYHLTVANNTSNKVSSAFQTEIINQANQRESINIIQSRDHINTLDFAFKSLEKNKDGYAYFYVYLNRVLDDLTSNQSLSEESIHFFGNLTKINTEGMHPVVLKTINLELIKALMIRQRTIINDQTQEYYEFKNSVNNALKEKQR